MNQSRKNWTEEEDKAICALVKKHGIKNWAEISQKMTSKYGIENRTGKQCRERWHNHLDPSINKNDWTIKEQKQMFEAHQKYGNKWTVIAKLFEGRTDNDIKNHFYSMLRRSLRRVNKLLGMRNSTRKIRVIKPSVLSKIFVEGNQDDNQLISEDKKKISQGLFQFSKSKSSDRDFNTNLDEEEKKTFEDLIERLLLYNEEYDLKRSNKKSSEMEIAENSVEVTLLKKQSNKEKTSKLKQIPLIKTQSIKSLRLRSKVSNESNKQIKQKKLISPIIISSQSLSKRSRKIKKISSIEEDKQTMKRQAKKRRNSIKESSASYIREPSEQFQFENQEEDKNFEIHSNEIIDLPQIHEIGRRTSSRLQNQSSSLSENFGLNSKSPRMDLRIFTRTPQGPTPNLADIFAKSVVNYEWKANNNELDNILLNTRRNIEKKSQGQQYKKFF